MLRCQINQVHMLSVSVEQRRSQGGGGGSTKESNVRLAKQLSQSALAEKGASDSGIQEFIAHSVCGV